jgi:N-acetylglucosaminyl-diphospho-decaprenol L-rhamnosyltransferase
MPDPVVRVVVVTFNSEDHILDCIRHIRASTGHSHEIVIVDNASEDRTVEVVCAHHPEIPIHEVKSNSGFAAAVNRGAQGAETPWIALVNPDALLSSGAIDELLTAADEIGEPVILGGHATRGGDPHDNISAWGFPTLWNQLTFASGLSSLAPRSRLLNGEAAVRPAGRMAPVDSVSGGFLMVPSSVWKDLGGLDERFVLYAEDGDLCARAAKRGIMTWSVTTASYEHLVGASSESSAARRILILKGKATFVRQHLRCSGVAIRLMLAGAWLRGRAANRVRSVIGTPHDESWALAWEHRAVWQSGWNSTETIDQVVALVSRADCVLESPGAGS